MTEAVSPTRAAKKEVNDISATYKQLVMRLNKLSKLDINFLSSVPPFPFCSNSMQISVACKISGMQDTWDAIDAKLDKMIEAKRSENIEKKIQTRKAEKMFLSASSNILRPESRHDPLGKQAADLQYRLDLINQRISDAKTSIANEEQLNQQLREQVAAMPAPPKVSQDVVNVNHAKTAVKTAELDIDQVGKDNLLKLSQAQKQVRSIKTTCDELEEQIYIVTQRIEMNKRFNNPVSIADPSRLPGLTGGNRSKIPRIVQAPRHSSVPARVSFNSRNPKIPLSARNAKKQFPKSLLPLPPKEEPQAKSARNHIVSPPPPISEPAEPPTRRPPRPQISDLRKEEDPIQEQPKAEIHEPEEPVIDMSKRLVGFKFPIAAEENGNPPNPKEEQK